MTHCYLYHVYMNKKKRNSYHLHHPFYFKYLTLFPIIFLIAGIIGAASLQKAQSDLRRIGRYLRGVNYNPNDRTSLVYHKVRDYDTLKSLSEEYGVSVDSIIWVNESSLDVISKDMVIIIPPVTGVAHKVANTDTVESIAAFYGVKPENIWNYPYNQFSDDPAFPLIPGSILMVPDGKKPKTVEP